MQTCCTVRQKKLAICLAWTFTIKPRKWP
jgi:hypothetical protein